MGAGVRLVATLSLLLASGAACAAAPRAPLISQRYPHGRSSDWHGENRCGPTSMAMIARGFHRRPELSDAALVESLDELDDGQVNRATAPAGIVRMSEALQL